MLDPHPCRSSSRVGRDGPAQPVCSRAVFFLQSQNLFPAWQRPSIAAHAMKGERNVTEASAAAPRFWSKALPPRASNSCSAIPAARCFRSMTRCSARTASATSSSGTKQAPPMRPKAMRAPPASPAWCSSRPAPARPTRHRHCRCLHGFDPAGRHHRAGADRPDRLGRVPGMPIRSASRATAPSTIIWSKTRPNSPPRSCTRRSASPPTGRPGPVVIDIPKDVQIASGLVPKASQKQRNRYNPRTEGGAAEITRGRDDRQSQARRCSTPAAASSIPGRRRRCCAGTAGS